MSETLTLLGLACIVAAVVGGGLKLAKIEIPLVASPRRQAILAGVGVLILVVNLTLLRQIQEDREMSKRQFVERLVVLCAAVNNQLAGVDPAEAPDQYARQLGGLVEEVRSLPVPSEDRADLERMLSEMQEASKHFEAAGRAAELSSEAPKEEALKRATARVGRADQAAQRYGMPPLDDCDEQVAAKPESPQPPAAKPESPQPPAAKPESPQPPAGQSLAKWRKVKDAPLARQQVASAVADDTIWVMGGLEQNAATAKIAGYEPAIDTWKLGPDLPLALHHAMAVTFRGELVIMGGWIPEGANLTATVSDRVFALRNGAWVELARMNRPRAAGAAAVAGDKIVVAGGQAGGGLVAQTSVFDGARWRGGAAIPTPREHLAGASDGRYFYAVGGRQMSSDKNLAAFERYDPAANRWEKLPQMPTARGGLGAAVVAGRLIAIGGEHPTGVFDKSEAYDLLGGIWFQLPALDVPRHGLAAAAVGNSVYALNGAARPTHARSSAAAEVLDFS